MIEQPILTYGKELGEVTFGIVTSTSCQRAPLVVLYNADTRTSQAIVADFTRDYVKNIDNVQYAKASYFYTAKVTPDSQYAWIAYATN